MDVKNKLGEAWNILQERLGHDPDSLSKLPTAMILCSIALALLLTALGPCWRVMGLVNTVVHESGHAMAALSTLGRLRGIRINMNHSGDTQYLSSTFLPFRIWSTWWGYAFPSVAGCGLIYAAERGWSGVALTACAAVAIIVTLQIRNFVALLSIGAVSAVILAAWWLLPHSIAAIFVLFLGWLLLLGGARSSAELLSIHLRGEGEDSDAMALRSMTLLPAYFWCATFIAVALYCLYLSTELLLG